MMDVENVKPFVSAFETVMPQLGFTTVVAKEVTQSTHLELDGVIIIVGLVGSVKGSVVYCMDLESAKRIVSVMMMGMPVTQIDEMAQSALSELTNMLTANAATVYTQHGEVVDISTPTLFQGDHVGIKMVTDEIIHIPIEVDGISIAVRVAIA